MKYLFIVLLVLFALPIFAEEDTAELSPKEKLEEELGEAVCDAYTRMNESALVLAKEERATKVSGVVRLEVNDYHGRRFWDAGEEMKKARRAYKAAFNEEFPEKRCKWIHEVSSDDLKLVNEWAAKKFEVKGGKKGK